MAINWKTSIAFVGLATLITILVGWLSSTGLLPISQTIQYTSAGAQFFIRAWLRVAVVIGVILPTIAFVVWFKHPEVRRIFGTYLLLVVIQIMTEHLVIRVGFRSLVVVIGTLYTAFRVWQLWQGLHQLDRAQVQRKSISNVLWLMLLFWSSNLIVLLTLGWSGILIRP